MVRTGARTSVLTDLLVRAGCQANVVTHPAPRLGDLDERGGVAVLELNRRLGGTHDTPNLKPGAWDLSIDGILIELDEELHFNRYRALSLEVAQLRSTPWTGPYQDHCSRRESDCLRAGRWGKRWTNESCACLFGEGADPGDLDGAGGSPRWKQRAMYDALKDVYAASSSDVRVARLAVWDEVSGRLLGDVLEERESLRFDDLLELLYSRTT